MKLLFDNELCVTAEKISRVNHNWVECGASEPTHRKRPRINCIRASAIARLTRAENDNLCRPHKLISGSEDYKHACLAVPTSRGEKTIRFNATNLLKRDFPAGGMEEITVKCRATIRNSCQVLINVLGRVCEQQSEVSLVFLQLSHQNISKPVTDPARLLSTNVTDVERGERSRMPTRCWLCTCTLINFHLSTRCFRAFLARQSTPIGFDFFPGEALRERKWWIIVRPGNHHQFLGSEESRKFKTGGRWQRWCVSRLLVCWLSERRLRLSERDNGLFSCSPFPPTTSQPKLINLCARTREGIKGKKNNNNKHCSGTLCIPIMADDKFM